MRPCHQLLRAEEDVPKLLRNRHLQRRHWQVRLRPWLHGRLCETKTNRCTIRAGANGFCDKDGEPLKPFSTFRTVRHKYKHHAFNVDVDTASFGEPPYSVAEIELMLSAPTGADAEGAAVTAATDKILEFAARLGLETAAAQPDGKVEQFLRLYDPAHLQLLQQAGVMQQ